MTKRKYKIFVRYTLLFLCLFPLILITINCIADGFNINEVDVNEVCEKFIISTEMTNRIANILPSFGITFDGNFGNIVPIIMSNSIIIFIMYVALEVALFMPKIAMYFFDMFTGGNKYE